MREWLRKRKHDYSATRVEGKKHLDQYCAAVPSTHHLKARVGFISVLLPDTPSTPTSSFLRHQSHPSFHSRNSRLLLRHFRDVTLPHHGNYAVADDCCAGGHLGVIIVQSIPDGGGRWTGTRRITPSAPSVARPNVKEGTYGFEYRRCWYVSITEVTRLSIPAIS